MSKEHNYQWLETQILDGQIYNVVCRNVVCSYKFVVLIKYQMCIDRLILRPYNNSYILSMFIKYYMYINRLMVNYYICMCKVIVLTNSYA
jgi:hypothetical protein